MTSKEIAKSKTRPIVKIKDNIDIKTLQYIAGFIDADGCFLIQSNAKSSIITIGQAEKGIDSLYYIYDNIGGSINLHVYREEDDNNQTSYTWLICGKDAIKFTNMIKDFLILKKREALIFIQFPTDTHIIPIIAINSETNEIREYDTLKECSKDMKYSKLAFKKQDKIICGNWEIKKKFTKDEINEMKKKRQELYSLLKEMKTTPHQEIPEDIQVSDAYFAGFFDGDGRFNTKGKSAQNHCISQKYPEICKLFHRTFGGTICYNPSKNQWNWEIYTGGSDFLKRISPYIVGKKKQAELIINMNPGESSKVHAQLRDLKGKGKMKTPEIDSINAGNPQYKTPVRALPKGVFKNNSTEYRAQLQHNKHSYVLGVFTDINEAHEKYLEVKRGIVMAKVNKEEYDMSGYPVKQIKP